MKKIRIMIVDAFQGLGGEEEVAFYIYKNLDRSKFDVWLAGPKEAKYFKKKHPNESEWIKCTTQGKFNIHKMHEFRNIVKKNRIEIINVHGYSAGYFIRLACIGLKNVKVIWTMHINIKDINTLNNFKLFVRTKVENILNKNSAFTNEIICVSKASVGDLKERGIKKIPIRVIHNGVNLKKFANAKHNLPTKDGELCLGFISRLSPQKGLPILLDAMKLLSAENKKIKLLIAGDGELKEYVKVYIQKNHLKNQVKLIGFQKDISKILKRIDAIVLPSYYECLPMIILEAGSAGIPAIASKVNGVPEEIKNNINGFLFSKGSTEQLVKCINKYFANKELLVNHGHNAEEIVHKKFSQDKMIEEYEKTFINIIDAKQ